MSRPRTLRMPMIGVCMIVVTACSPDDLNGVGRAPAGDLVVKNCGTYIRGIEFRDSDSGREIWSAAIGPDVAVYDHDVGEVEIGVPPDDAWIVAVAFDHDATPATWEILIDTGDDEPTEIRVPDSDIRKGEMVVPGRAPVTEREFIDDVCGFAPPTDRGRWWVIGGGTLVAAAIGIVIIVADLIRSRHRPEPSARDDRSSA